MKETKTLISGNDIYNPLQIAREWLAIHGNTPESELTPPDKDLVIVARHLLAISSTSHSPDDQKSNDNWSLIIKKYAPLIGHKYKDHRGEYSFFGLVHADDDYYYGMLRKDGRLVLASCVGSLESMYEEIK